MMEKTFTVMSKSGLHARPAAQFVQIANKYESSVKILKDGQAVNGKSIMGLLMLAAEKGSKLTMCVDGPDEEKAMEELSGILINEEE